MKIVFINEALDKAINDYIISKDKKEGILYNSFLVVIIRLLINIYGELDIINPFQTKNEDAFNTNLAKYGFLAENVLKFEEMMNKYYHLENEKNLNRYNPYFIAIQKIIIDMFNIKRLNFGLVASEQKEFFDLLYTPGSSNVLRQSYNYLKASNIYEVAEYFKETMTKSIVVDNKKQKEKALLPFDIYKSLGIGISKLSRLNYNDVVDLNKQIYKSFDINDNAVNKDYLLKEKINQLRMENMPVTSGNGYVDILIIMSVVITTIMTIVLFITLIF